MDTAVDDALLYMAGFAQGNYLADSDRFSLAHRLSSALGWQEFPARIERFTRPTNDLSLERGFLGPQCATVFATNGTDASRRRLSDAALFAYHSSAQWGIIADSARAVVFNSHWIRSEQWFQLPEIRWTEIEAHRPILEALTPERMAAGELDRLARKVYGPERLLTPVDDALVASLDKWRIEALRYGRNSDHLDEDLHTLFAQLFILRAVEDRGLAPGVPSLQSALSAGSIDKGQLFVVFDAAQQAIQNLLFSQHSLEQFPEFIIYGIVRDLYTPSQLPEGSQRYNFSWIDADVLGRAYEKYLASVFEPAPISPQLAFWNQPEREVSAVNVKKSGGVFYTPHYLVGALTDYSLARRLQQENDDFIPRIADFACGSGSFLVEAVSVLLRRLRQFDPTRNWARTLISERRIIGVDLDARAVALSRMNLWIRFTEEPNALPLPSIDEVIVEGDSLSEELFERIPQTYDLILGNPPFLATGHTQPREELGRRFRAAQGRYDYAYLFLELAITRLNPGGVVAMVMPNRLFRNLNAGPIRDMLTSETDVLAVIDFGVNEVFEGTSAYIGGVIARKKESAGETERPATRVIVVDDISGSRYLGSKIVDALAGNELVTRDTMASFDLSLPFGGVPWMLITPSERDARFKLEAKGNPLGGFAGVFQGIRTGANDIFILRVISSDRALAQAVNGLGDQAIVEIELLHPVVFGTEIQRYEVVSPSTVILYPYRRGSTISEYELQERYPNAYAYLSRYRNALAGRGSIQSSRLTWYELVRKRDEEWLSSPKLIMRDLATSTAFALDPTGQSYLVGGTAVVPPNNETMFPLLGFLNSRIANDYLAQMTPTFRGAYQKFEPQHLTRLPVPSFIQEPTEHSERLAELVIVALNATRLGDSIAIREAEASIEDTIRTALDIVEEG